MTAASPDDHPETLVAYVGCYTTKERNGRGDGISVYAANQNSDTIVGFRVDPASGKLMPTGHVVKAGSPSSIVFA